MADNETFEEKEKGSDGVVKRWLQEIKLSEKVEKNWCSAAEECLKIYSSDAFIDDTQSKRKETFNILWANVETKRPALYDSLPSPDVRRRYRDENPVGRACAEVLERAIAFTIDEGFDREIIAAVNDMLLPGRAVTRVKYVPAFSEPEVDQEGEERPQDLVSQEIQYEQVQWDDFRRGPGRTWKEVPWIAFKHEMKKSVFEERWPDFKDAVSFSSSQEEGKDNHAKTDDSTFRTTTVWEIWDKEERKVVWVAESYKDKALETLDDPLGLKNFFCIPEPMYAIENPTSLIPTCEYTMYETLAKELERLTNRINKIINGLRLRGIYDSTMREIEKLFEQGDNAFIPVEDVSRLLEEGGFQKAIWMLPIREMAEVLQYLYQRREALIIEIYEITGISDIQRGATDPDETLGAQQLKANFGSQRLSRQQIEVQKYIRELIKITGEIISEHFEPEMLAMMTGLQFPTGQEKMMAQAQIQMMAQSGQQPPPELQQVLSRPSWDDIMQVLKSDVLREFRIDIETDSTIQRQQVRDEESITKLLGGISSFIAGIGPAIEAGQIPADVAKKILMASVRRFDLGREVEEALDQADNQPRPQQQQGPDSEQQKAQAEAQAVQAESQAKMQKIAADGKIAQLDAQLKEQEHQWAMEELNMKREQGRAEHAAKMAEYARRINEPMVVGA